MPSTRTQHLRAYYRLSLDQYDALAAAQGGVCAICGREAPEHVDHSHDSGAVRGILCFNCNGGLGQFRDSIDSLVNAVAYLQAHDPEAAGQVFRTVGDDMRPGGVGSST